MRTFIAIWEESDMYLEKVSSQAISKAKSKIDDVEIFDLKYLEKNGYRLSYYYDIPDKVITYIAIAKDFKDCYLNLAEPYLCFSVDSQGTIKGSSGFHYSALLYYLCQKEKEMGEEKVKKIYQDITSASDLVEGLTPEQAQEKIETRKVFLDFLKKVEREKETPVADDTSDKVRAYLSFEKPAFYNEPSILFSLTLMMKDKNVEVKDLYRFLTGFARRDEYALSTKKKVLLESASFFSPYDKVLPTLGANVSFFRKTKVNTYDIALSALALVLDELGDEKFSFMGETATIHEEDDVSFSLNEKGEPVFSPEYEDVPSKKKYVRMGKNNVFVFDFAENTIQRYAFPNAKMKMTYLFFIENKKKKFEYIKDMFNEKLLPDLSKSLRKGKTDSKKGAKPFEIALYLTIDEDKGLSFKTTYLENGEEVKDVRSELGESMKSAYLSVLKSLGRKENGTIRNEDEIVSFLSQDLSPLLNLVSFFCDERLKKQNMSVASGFKVNVAQKGDYLALTLDNDKYTKEELENILFAYQRKRKYFLLKNSLLFLTGEEMEDVGQLFPEGKTHEDNVPLYHLFSLESGKVKTTEDDACRKTLSEIKEFSKMKISLEKEAGKLVRPYQEEGIKYLLSLYKHGFGGILADEMGLGKTFETICFLSLIKEKKPILIITPKAVLYNWESEIHRFSSLPAVVIDSNKENRQKTIQSIEKDKKVLYLISYDTYKRDASLFSDIEFSSVILDEAQQIKNAFSMRHQALMSLHSRNRIALTGTPLENSPMDLWAIFSFLMPGYFGDDKAFSELLNSKEGMDRMSLLLKPFLLRRRKEDVLKDLPGKSENNVLIAMSESERMLYLAYLEKARGLSKENRISILSSLTRLRQLCVDPSSFLEGFDTSTKLEYTLNLIKENIQNGHKAIVFSSFKSALLDLKSMLDEENVKNLIITGDTSGKDRLAFAQDFNTKDEYKVILVSLKAGGVGLNLIGADTVIHLDPWWNPQAENQATDRAHRIGQTRPVTVLRLIMKDTVEEKVLKLQTQKKDLYNEIVENNGGASSLTDEDISYLLS